MADRVVHPIIAQLHARRRQLGLTQTDVAKLTGLSKTTLCELEKGIHSPKLTSTVAYAKAVGLELALLSAGTSEATR